MKLLISILSCLMLASPWSNASVLIKNVRVISPGAPVSEPVDVYIEGDTIRAMGKVPDRADQVIEGAGRYLTPGLIDSHVHLQGVPGESPDMSETVREQALAQIPKSYLYFGFTTVLDLISTDDVIEHWNNQPLAPTAYHCVGVPIPGGYPLAWLPVEQQLQAPAAQYFLYDPRQRELMRKTPESEQHRPQPLVARIAQTGARCIKIFYETGFGRLNNLPVPTQDMVHELVAEARKHQLPVYLHGNSQQAHAFALDAGVNMVVHGLWHGELEQATHVAKQVADRGLKVQPTMQVIYGERDLFDPDFLNSSHVMHVMPQALMEWYRSEAGQWMQKEMAQGLLPADGHHPHAAVQLLLHEPIKTLQVYVDTLIQHRAKLIFGSDTPSGPIYTQFPGLNGWREMQRWVEAGVSPEQLFHALTIDNARELGLQHLLGTVEVGKRADLLLLEHNPLKSVTAWNTIDWVIVKGKPVKRELLSAQRLERPPLGAQAARLQQNESNDRPLVLPKAPADLPVL